jgi:hypothetical protein
MDRDNNKHGVLQTLGGYKVAVVVSAAAVTTAGSLVLGGRHCLNTIENKVAVGVGYAVTGVSWLFCTGVAYLTLGVGGLTGSLVFDLATLYLTNEPRGVCGASAVTLGWLGAEQFSKSLLGEAPTQCGPYRGDSGGNYLQPPNESA